MKKVFSAIVIGLLCFSIFSIFTAQVQAPQTYKMLIDEGHSEWLVSGNAQTLIQALEDKGYAVDAFSGTITQSLLSAYDAFLIGIAWGSFTQSEMQAIEDFVKDGGGLWLIGLGWSWVGYHPDSTIYDYPMNQIAQRFGAFYNDDIIFDPTDYTTDPGSAIFHSPFIYSHPVTQGVSQIGATGMVIGSISIQIGTILITGDDDSYGSPDTSPYPNPGSHPPLLAAIECSLGRVIIGSHEGFFHDDHVYEYDNKILGLNIVDWLLTPVARVEIDPDTLNLKSKGKLISAYIELPVDYDVNDIDIYTVRLNGEISAELHPTEIGDYDADSILDLMVKFDRQDLIVILSAGEATLTVTGEVNGTPFDGSDTIRVIDE